MPRSQDFENRGWELTELLGVRSNCLCNDPCWNSNFRKKDVFSGKKKKKLFWKRLNNIVWSKLAH